MRARSSAAPTRRRAASRILSNAAMIGRFYAAPSPASSRRAGSRTAVCIGAGIAAGRRDRQPAEVVDPTFLVVGLLRGIGQAAVDHAQQRAAVLLDQVDLDQARSRRHVLVAVPAEA